MKKTQLLISILILLPLLVFSQEIRFSGDSVYSYIEYLSEEIGPRPMGSENEGIALDWARGKFQSFGADTAFTLRFNSTESRGIQFNTQSGVSVGIFKGKTDSAIVVGGHIDSAGEEFPGANDDGSGSSTAIELARIWSQRERHYTMVFCTFGGEESGLIGSEYFANNYNGMDDVALMISADMAGSDEDIIIMFQGDSIMAPKWLVKDAFKVANELGYDNLYYPTHFATINHIGGGGAGSDHMSFLNKGIPAIDFTAGINDFPIHTPQDQLQFMTASMFQNYGDFVDALISNYQEKGIPSEKSIDYYLWNFLGIDFYIPYMVLLIFNIISVLIGIGAFIYARRQKLDIPKKERIRWSGWKLFLFLIIIAIFTQLGEAFMQMFKGLRYPWFIEISAYLWFALIWTISGIWVVLQLTKKWKFYRDPYSYVFKAFISLFFFIILFSLSGTRLAFYPALAIFLFSLAIFVKQPLLKTLFAFLAIIPTFSLIFHEAFDFFAHGSAYLGFAVNNFGWSLAHSASLTLLLIIFFLPFIYVFSYAVMTNNTLKSNLRVIRQPLYGISLIFVIIGYGIYLFTMPAYNEMWRPTININAKHKIHANESELEIVGNEYFTDVNIKTDSLDEYYDSGVHKIDVPYAFANNWLNVSGEEKISTGEMDTVRFDWTLSSTHRWMRATVKVLVDTGQIISPESDFTFHHKDSLLQYSWNGGFRDSLNIKGQFLVTPGAKLIRKVTTRYPEVPDNIEVTSKLANIRPRTTMSYIDTLVLSLNRGMVEEIEDSENEVGIQDD